MKKAKVILIALFFIANLFANCDLRFGDGKIVDLVDKLAFAEKIPGKNDDEPIDLGGGGEILCVEGIVNGKPQKGYCRLYVGGCYGGSYIHYTKCKVIENYLWICVADYYTKCLKK